MDKMLHARALTYSKPINIAKRQELIVVCFVNSWSSIV